MIDGNMIDGNANIDSTPANDSETSGPAPVTSRSKASVTATTPTETERTVEPEATVVPAAEPTCPASGYIEYASHGEGGEFADPEGGYRCHLIRDYPVPFGTPDTCITARYAARLVEDGKAIYCEAPTG